MATEPGTSVTSLPPSGFRVPYLCRGMGASCTSTDSIIMGVRSIAARGVSPLPQPSLPSVLFFSVVAEESHFHLDQPTSPQVSQRWGVRTGAQLRPPEAAQSHAPLPSLAPPPPAQLSSSVQQAVRTPSRPTLRGQHLSGPEGTNLTLVDVLSGIIYSQPATPEENKSKADSQSRCSPISSLRSLRLVPRVLLLA